MWRGSGSRTATFGTPQTLSVHTTPTSSTFPSPYVNGEFVYGLLRPIIPTDTLVNPSSTYVSPISSGSVTPTSSSGGTPTAALFFDIEVLLDTPPFTQPVSPTSAATPTPVQPAGGWNLAYDDFWDMGFGNVPFNRR